MRREFKVLLLLLVTIPLFLHAQQPPSKSVQQGAGADWPTYTGNPLGWEYSSLDQINTSNVKKLVPAWIFQTGDYAESLQATPIVVDGVIYITTARSYVFAIDGVTGGLIFSQLLTLYITPVIYTYMDALEKKLLGLRKPKTMVQPAE